MNKKTLLKVLTLTIFSTFALANDASAPTQKVSGVYLGGGGGLSYGSSTLFLGTYQDENSQYTSNTLSDTSQAYLIYAGYQFNKIIAVEASYRNYGSFSDTSTALLGATKTFTTSPDSYSVYANAGYTFSNGLRPFAQLGLGYTYLNASSSSQDIGLKDSASFVFGMGLEYAPVKLAGLGFRLGYVYDMIMDSSYNANDNGRDTSSVLLNLNVMYYVGAQYKF